jgi:hypothetical protein
MTAMDLYVVAIGLLGSQTLTDELLEQILGQLKRISPDTTDDQLKAIKKRLESNLGVRSTPGYSLHGGDQEPWLEAIKPTIKWDYWNAYVNELKTNGFNTDVIRVLDEDTNNILNECGNPSREGPWRIKGLVMGDVQSGKTANYCGLVNKAADVGYRVIILLTGVIEELRSQTQARLDSGFVGKDSREILLGNNGGSNIGSGRFRSKTPNVLTSVDSDFLTSNKKALGGIPLRNIQEPVLLVMKKNKTALSNLKSFLETQMSGNSYLDVPMLMIDDEADNASVNAKKDEDPATINKLIRQLLESFTKSSYCAYTATPFANVFITPEGEDLFPENFVYSLNAPSSYIGVSKIFREDGEHHYQLETIDDIEEFIPENHKKDFIIVDLPPSLKEAIRVFFITCAIRDIRGEPLKHRSMLINVSRFTDVQNRLSDVVKNYAYDLTEEIKQYLAADALWSRHELLNQLHKSWERHFSGAGIGWDEIRKTLYSSIFSVKTITINQKTEDTEKLNYTQYPSGRRVIAIGGLTLSRGLTLEGLSTSYFYRNSKAYDTLLQMGRWFGYRVGYEDLCRVWAAEDAQEWFEYIADVVDELRLDIKRMHVNRKPPKLFGMRVRSHPGALLVTARNKMRNAKEIEIAVSFSGYKAETPFIPNDKNLIEKNISETKSFLSELGTPSKAMGTRRIWEGVPASQIATYLSTLSISNMNFAFMETAPDEEKPLIKFIRENTVESLSKWDVCLPQGSGNALQEFILPREDGVVEVIKSRGRQFSAVPPGANFYKLNKQRVGESEDEKVGLLPEAIKEAEAEWRRDSKNDGKVTVPGKAFTAFRHKPLLTIHLVTPVDPRESKTSKSEKSKKPRSMAAADVGEGPFVAIGLNFPCYEENGNINYVPYKLNRIALAQLGLISDEDDGEEDED